LELVFVEEARNMGISTDMDLAPMDCQFPGGNSHAAIAKQNNQTGLS
jgi:hypothetical protein